MNLQDVFLYFNVETSALPQTFQSHLHSLFHQIETEFGAIYAENLELKKNIEELTVKLSSLDTNHLSGDKVEANHSNGSDGQKVTVCSSGLLKIRYILKFGIFQSQINLHLFLIVLFYYCI